MTIDTAAIRNAARTALEGPWVAPINSPLDVVLPATYRDTLPVTVASAQSRAEAQFITAFDPMTVLALLERKVPTPAVETLGDHAHGARPGIRSARRVTADFYEVSIDGDVVVTTDSPEIAAYLVLMDKETVFAVLDRAVGGA